MPSFEFNQQLVPQSLVDIEEVGQVALEGINEEGLFWYLIIKTSLGTTTIAECGPVVPDVDFLPDSYGTRLTRMPYKEDKLERYVNMWLNDRSKKLTEAKVIKVDDALDEFRDIGTYMRNYSDTTF